METINATGSSVKSPVKVEQARLQILHTQLQEDAESLHFIEVLLEGPIAFHRVFVKIGGGVTAGLMLSQLWYWSKNKTVKARGGWFYKTQAEWEEETGLTRREQETARRKLVDLGFLEEKLKGVPAKMHFHVNTKEVIEALKKLSKVENSAKENVQTSMAESAKLGRADRSGQYGGKRQTITKTTSEITPENTHTRAAGALGVVGGSKFSLSECRRYAEHLQSSGQGINNPGGFARTIHKSGSEDELIGLYLAKLEPERVESGELPAPIDTTACPDCEGRGVYYPDPLNPSKGAAKCRHLRLKQPKTA